MRLKSARLHTKAFTLIELLVVISLVMILAGTLFVVLNPAEQRRKANETVLKATLAKACLALNSCGTSYDDRTKCDTFSDIGVNTLSGPQGASYSISLNGASSVRLGGVVTSGSQTCSLYCDFDFATGASTKVTKIDGTSCIIEI